MRFRSFLIGLWCERERVSKSMESDLESGDFIIAVIIVFVTVPKKP